MFELCADGCGLAARALEIRGVAAVDDVDAARCEHASYVGGELRRRQWCRSCAAGEDISNHDVPGGLGESFGDGAGFSDADAQKRRTREVEPIAYEFRQSTVDFDHHLTRVGVRGGEVSGHGAGATAEMKHPQALGLVTFGIDQMRDPPHVLEIEHRGIRDVHVGTGHSVDLDDPTVIGVLIAD